METHHFNGALIVDKPAGITSHDVVAITRRALKQKKIGHCGTLDPMATGILILVLGKGTKLQDKLMAEVKEYTGTIHLGVETSSLDKEGDITKTSPIGDYSDSDISDAFDQFMGDFNQIPPMVSAIKKDGVRLYKLAREGKTIERPPRSVSVYEYEITKISLPEIQFRVVCSKGFYVRSYAHDIGNILGCGGHLSELRRTKSGNFTTEDCICLEDLRSGDEKEITQKVIPIETLKNL